MAQTVAPLPYGTPLNHPDWCGVVAALESEPCSAYILAPDLSLLHVNAGWRRFAQDNGAPALAERWRSLGPLLSAVTPPLRQFFAVCLTGALSRKQAWSHTYECSSLATYRRFHMRAHAGPAQEGLVVVHSLVAESRLPHRAPHGLVRQFTDMRGLIVRCAACGRTKRPGEAHSWEWAPSLDREPNISTGICAVCSMQEYGYQLAGG
jgi:hypothetical protein